MHYAGGINKVLTSDGKKIKSYIRQMLKVIAFENR